MRRCNNFWLILLITFFFIGCQNLADNNANSAVPGWQTNANEAITLDWYINFNWFSTTWDQSLVAKTITEETGVSINFVTPAGNEWEKLNSMITSDTLPDLITLGHWEPQIDQMIANEQVYALNLLADEYDAYFWEVAHPQRVAWYTTADGNIYGYPNSSYTPSDYEKYDNIGANQTFLVRRDIYEALGEPDMTTPDGFKQAIRDAAALFPEENGQPLIPIGLYDFDKDGCYSLEGILMNLLAVPFEENGVLVDRHTHPDYIRWLKVFRELYGEGYLPSDIFIDRRLQTAEKVSQGRYFCMLYQHTDIADQQKLLYHEHPGKEYIAVDGPKNSKGDDHKLPGVGINGWTVTLISKNCKRPDRALQLMSYLMSSHGQMITYCGVEGVTYDLIDGAPVIKPEILALLNRDRAEYNRLYAADNTYWMLQDLPMQLDWQPPSSPPLAQPLEWTFPYTVYAAQYELSLEEGTEAANAHLQIREEWVHVLSNLIMAENDEEFDKIMSAFIIKREQLGFTLVQEEAQKQLEINKVKLSALE